jgi:dolichol-phosphate mannosyltransferase
VNGVRRGAPTGRHLLLALRLVLAARVLREVARARRRAAPLTRLETVEGLPTISVVVPARNEESRIGPLLDALRDAPGVAEVLVVDDCSTDGTAALATAAGATVVSGREPPPGWAGKAWAVQQGIEAATGEWVVTLDADARPDPALPAAAVRRAATDGCDLVTVAGRFECPTTGLALVHPAMLTTLVYRFGPGDSIPAPRRPLANGQCMVLPRAAFRASGALAAVAGEVVEDVALARRIAEGGGRVAMVDGGGLLVVRMYEDAADAWRNWGRSLSLPGVDGPVRRVVDLAGLVVAQALPLPRLLTGRADALDLVLLAARAGTLAGTADTYVGRRSVYWASPAADPVAVASVALGVVRSLRRRPVHWRGRTYG